MEVKLSGLSKINDKTIESIDMKLNELTGEDILKIDTELRAEGHSRGLQDVFDQNVLLRLASKGSGYLTDDLRKLKAPDFLEVTFTVRNFLLGLSEETEEQTSSDESSLN